MKIVHVTTPDERLRMELSSTNTVGDLKSIVKSRAKIPKHRQRFILGTYLLEEDDAPLSRFNIKTGDELKLVISSKYNIEIYVKTMTEEKEKILMKPNQTINDLKRMIMSKFSIPPMAQRLINEDELLDVGEHTLDECHIREYSTLTVINILDTPTSSTPINITIKAFQGYKKELDVLSNDTVLSVKDRSRMTQETLQPSSSSSLAREFLWTS